MFISNLVSNATNIDTIVNAINDGGICEGMEGVEFTPEQLAGEYAYHAAVESGCDYDSDTFDAHLEILQEAGAEFMRYVALEHSEKIAACEKE